MDETQQQATPEEQLEDAKARIGELEAELEAAKSQELISEEEQRRRWGQEMLDAIERA